MEFYLPLPKLVFLRNRYLLPNEDFKFLSLEPVLSSSTDLGPWAFLRDDIGIPSVDSKTFYLTLLYYVQKYNPGGTVEFPRRVLELYLRLHAASEMGGEKVRVYIR